MTDDPHAALRELLYGDVPLGQWAGSGEGAPWSQFRAAAAAIDAGEPDTARPALHEVLRVPDLESRHYLQAWHALRLLGEQPPAAQAQHLYGMVFDVPMPTGGSDTLAAYADHTCRYLNYRGSAIIWDIPDATIGALIDELFATGRTILAQIGPWDGPRPPVPPGEARLSLLCPNGLSFGQADLDTLMSDPIAASALSLCTQLLVELTDRQSP